MSNTLLRAVFGEQLNETYTLGDAYNIFAEKNLVDPGEIAELAISITSGIAQCVKNAPNIDLVTGVQIKHARTNPKSFDGRLNAWYSTNSTAPILLVVTERLTQKQYYFYIRPEDRAHIKANAISIVFYKDGTPRKDNYWWNHEVPTYEDLCELAKIPTEFAQL
jgi:hypothetical protein